MKISVIILSYNTKNITKTAIEKALVAKVYCQKQQKNKVEIIVVDNGSTDGSKAMLKKISGIELINLEKNEGVAVGYNVGMRKAQYEYILLINNDTYLYEETLSDALDWMKKNKKADVVIGHLIDRNNYFGSYGGALPTPFKTIRLFLGIDFIPFVSQYINRIYRMEEKYDKDLELEWIPTCFFFMKRIVFEKTGGHDEQMFFYMEDLDFCKKIKEKGFHIWYTPQIKATHLGGQSSQAKWEMQALLQRQIDGMIYYQKKHYPHSLSIVRFFMQIGLRSRGLFYLLKGNRNKAIAHFKIAI